MNQFKELLRKEPSREKEKTTHESISVICQTWKKKGQSGTKKNKN